MNIDLATLPSDVNTLHRLVRDLAAQVAGDQTELAQAQAEIQRLHFVIQRLQRSQFGRRSERIDGDQLALGLKDLDVDIASGDLSDRYWLRRHASSPRTSRASAARGCGDRY